MTAVMDAKETQAMLILTRKVDQGITVLRQELWHEGEENQPFEKKDRTANGHGDADHGPSAASA
jgi:hypothetical protein